MFMPVLKGIWGGSLKTTSQGKIYFRAKNSLKRCLGLGVKISEDIKNLEKQGDIVLDKNRSLLELMLNHLCLFLSFSVLPSDTKILIPTLCRADLG